MEMVKLLLFFAVGLFYMQDVAGNCSDTFSCDCFTSGPLVDVRLSSKVYEISSPTSCVLSDRTSITIAGSPRGTMLICTADFNIVFNNSRNITISDITMVNCGGKISEAINRTITNATSRFYFGKGTTYALMFLYSTDITLDYVMIVDSPGYSIIALNALGTVELLRSFVDDSTSSVDIDSGSGVAFLYTNQPANDSKLNIHNCLFYNNTAIIPKGIYERFLRQMNLGHTNDNITILGAASVTIYYLQENYNVVTNISDADFINNNGTFSGSVAIVQTHNAKSRTQFNNCVFHNSKGVRDFSNSDIIRIGGIYYINFQLDSNINLEENKGKEFEVLTISHCSFNNLEGKLGAAFHIEKNALDAVYVVVRIEHCSFANNSADTGSVLYAKDRSTKSPYKPLLGGGLTIYLVDINVEDNGLPSGSSIQGATSNFITGVFYVFNCLVTLQCTDQCKFVNNKPSVFYAYSSALTMSGGISFLNNKARFGGAIRLIDTVMYVNINSSIYFKGNNVTENGGAIEAEVPLTNIQSQDYCPFQFVGLPLGSPIIDNDIITGNFKSKTNINITLEENYAGVVVDDNSNEQTNIALRTNERVESIYSNVFYVCSWFPGTSVQTTIGPDTTKKNEDGTRLAVYLETFNYKSPSSAREHLNILAILPCICNENNSYTDHVSDCLNGQVIDMSQQLKVIPGRKFLLRVISIDTVGSVGYSTELISRAYTRRNNTDEVLGLEDSQLLRAFSVSECVEMDYTVYSRSKETMTINEKGILSLSVAVPRVINVSFSFEDCPTGYEIRQVQSSANFACLCKPFIDNLKGFNCDATSGVITRLDTQAWLGLVHGDIQHLKLCSPSLCNQNPTIHFNSDDNLCVDNHIGRACGSCKDGFGRVFGSDSCKQCSNYWLFTIPLYALSGVLLVVILVALKFTVTVGLVNGLIFFCNVMSINEQLFFNGKINHFSFLRFFISIFNLDLGFEICFYKEMSQVAKTGLQFVFPVYLWPLIVVIVYMSRYSRRFQGRVSHTAVPVFATLILLSYAKLLRTAISVFSFTDIDSMSSTTLRVWRPDPSVEYWHDGHAALFFIATLFLLFIFPFAISFTYPRILHHKKFSYLFPFFDCFTAPYKGKYRYWFGVRAVILIYLALMETIIFDDKEALLLSNLIVIGTYAIVQAYIRPFKSTIVNCSDLTFTAIFLALSSTVLYIHPTANDLDSKKYDGVNVAVYIFGYMAFFFFCLVVAYHIHVASKKARWYIKLTENFWNKLKKHKDNSMVNIIFSSTTITRNATINRYHNNIEMQNLTIPKEERFQDSFYDET